MKAEYSTLLEGALKELITEATMEGGSCMPKADGPRCTVLTAEACLFIHRISILFLNLGPSSPSSGFAEKKWKAGLAALAQEIEAKVVVRI
jgi:hypothetical protein